VGYFRRKNHGIPTWLDEILGDDVSVLLPKEQDQANVQQYQWDKVFKQSKLELGENIQTKLGNRKNIILQEKVL
jgi:hypothetical protein